MPSVTLGAPAAHPGAHLKTRAASSNTRPAARPHAHAPSRASRGALVLTRASSTDTDAGAEMLERATTYTSDLQEMGMKMNLIRRAVAGPKNDLKVREGCDVMRRGFSRLATVANDLSARRSAVCLSAQRRRPFRWRRVAIVGRDPCRKALKVFQEALDGVYPDDEDEQMRLEKVLRELNDLRADKAEEELFWAEREGRVVSSLTEEAKGLSDDEKIEVGNIITNITMYGVQGAVWNALILLVVFISLVNFILR